MSKRKRYQNSSRDPGGFVAIPWSVLDSDAYKALSYAAQSLLIEVARQFHGDDNGRMLLSRKYLEKRGWPGAKSHSLIQRATTELIDAGLIFRTVEGQRPNKAAWFAVTWMSLDKLDGYDEGIERLFVDVRGAYRIPKKIVVPSQGLAER